MILAIWKLAQVGLGGKPRAVAQVDFHARTLVLKPIAPAGQGAHQCQARIAQALEADAGEIRPPRQLRARMLRRAWRRTLHRHLIPKLLPSLTTTRHLNSLSGPWPAPTESPRRKAPATE